jgi:MATE family multidrug resistance protein
MMSLQNDVVEGASSAAKILSFGLLSQMIGIGCCCYLEAMRRPFWVTFLSYVGVVLNLILNLALVAGWWGMTPMGADGVAWATTISRSLVAIAMVLLVVMTSPALKKSAPGPENEFIRQNTLGLGSALTNIAEYVAFNMTFVIATLASVLVGTVFTLALQPVFFSFMMFMGIATATSVRVAEYYGRGEMEKVKDASRLGVVAGGVAGLILIMTLFLTKNLIAAGMAGSETMLSPDIVTLLAGVIGVACLMLLFDGLQVIGAMALRAQGVVWLPVAIHLFSFIGVMLPATYHFTINLGWGAEGTMWGVVLGTFCAGVGQCVCLEYKTARQVTQRAV